MRPSCCLLLFTKPAHPGRVKTRLIGELSAQDAADLHAAFFEDLVARMRRGRFDLRIAWALDPHEALPVTVERGLRQIGVNLGERLFGTLQQVVDEYRFIAAIGSDHPDLSLSLVHQAFDKLAEGAEVVLGPAQDGGYYLVAVPSRLLRPELFRGIPWSTPNVLKTTLERCEELGLEAQLISEAGDVDTPEDLNRLILTLEQHPEVGCPRTRQILVSWGRLEMLHGEGGSDENP